MAIYVYGRSLPVTWRAWAGQGYAAGEGVAIQSLVNARIYPDSPTDAQIDDYLAALGGFEGAAKVTFTASDATKLTYTVTFDAIDDPDPHSNQLYDKWYPVWNIRYQASEQIKFLHVPILVWRPIAQFSQLDIEATDVSAIETEIADQLTDDEVEAFIVLAQESIFERIKALKLDRGRLQEADLAAAVKRLAASYCMRDMATRNNDYFQKADYWETKYEEIWKQLPLPIDEDGDGVVEPGEVAETFRATWMVM